MAAKNELRVFISSTFRDLNEEREHLAWKAGVVNSERPEADVLSRVEIFADRWQTGFTG